MRSGPFLLALLERLDLATTNSLQLNLLLMSVISRLAHYPQPLLRSLLLNPTLVCQPSVRSLIQVRRGEHPLTAGRAEITKLQTL